MLDGPFVLTGSLQTGHWDFSMVMEGDGVWRLELTGQHATNLGRRVTIEGTRADFDLIGKHGIDLPDRQER